MEHFGLSHALNAHKPPVWLPHNLFDQLLMELGDAARFAAPQQQSSTAVNGVTYEKVGEVKTARLVPI